MGAPSLVTLPIRFTILHNMATVRRLTRSVRELAGSDAIVGETVRSALALLVVGVVGSVGFAPAAAANPVTITVDQVRMQCEAQYPRNAAFTAGSPYLVAPNDAYSWRCQRLSLAPNGGAITGLGVDLVDFCQRNSGIAIIDDPRSPEGWRCE